MQGSAALAVLAVPSGVLLQGRALPRRLRARLGIRQRRFRLRRHAAVRTDVLRPCKYHTEMLAGFRNYIDTSDASVQSRRTLQDEVDTLNDAVKAGLAEHVGRDEYAPIAHRNEWGDDLGEGEGESESERQLRELQDELWDARMELGELRRGPPTRDAETQTDF